MLELFKALLGWVTETIEVLGPAEGLFAVFFVVAHGVIFWQYKARLDDRQGEIDRITADIRDYRDRFTHFLDEKIGYKPEKTKNLENEDEDA